MKMNTEMKTETRWERNERTERKTESAKVKDQLSVVVPCFNEEESLTRFFEETTKVLEEMEKKEGADLK